MVFASSESSVSTAFRDWPRLWSAIARNTRISFASGELREALLEGVARLGEAAKRAVRASEPREGAAPCVGREFAGERRAVERDRLRLEPEAVVDARGLVLDLGVVRCRRGEWKEHLARLGVVAGGDELAGVGEGHGVWGARGVEVRSEG